ncbi:hypothetical protein [Allorhizobium taibaishanense]|uniref:DUF680 domain-containing protein n=1 Tax=Allorhizobium taibaishanense TaxID=887144 RepID=A0A1Q9A3B1_9HYPH|nr:hypothetical protein [Allorhizobium taibaishanense]MBB4006076.1 hypothetical protein [Allorhizobium taibaishanense]OLP49085.1 hypothetical protein BJF91_18465 [Allorhizobium taibaishanense]
MKFLIATTFAAIIASASVSLAAAPSKANDASSQSASSEAYQQSDNSTWQFKAPAKEPHHRNQFNR